MYYNIMADILSFYNQRSLRPLKPIKNMYCENQLDYYEYGVLYLGVSFLSFETNTYLGATLCVMLNSEDICTFFTLNKSVSEVSFTPMFYGH